MLLEKLKCIWKEELGKEKEEMESQSGTRGTARGIALLEEMIGATETHPYYTHVNFPSPPGAQGHASRSFP